MWKVQVVQGCELARQQEWQVDVSCAVVAIVGFPVKQFAVSQSICPVAVCMTTFQTIECTHAFVAVVVLSPSHAVWWS